MKKGFLLGCGALIAGSALAVGTVAVATPGVNAPAPESLVAGVLDGPTNAKSDGIQLKVKGDTTVRNFILRYTPGSNSGWHSHPGIVVAIVESGTVTRRLATDCQVQTFTAGQVFTEVPGHFVANPSTTEDAVLRITQFFPTGSSPLREDIQVDPCAGR